MSRLRIPLILAHGISGELSRNSSESWVAASPIISISLTKARRRIRSLARSCGARSLMKAVASAAASSMCRRRIRSRPFILRESGGDHLGTEVAAQVLGCAQINLASLLFRKLHFHARQGDQARCMAGIEFHQNVEVAIRTKMWRKHRAKERKFADMISFAELLQEVFGNRKVKSGHRRGSFFQYGRAQAGSQEA